MFPKQLQTSKIAKVQASDTADGPLHSSSNNRLAACLLSTLKVGVTSDVVFVKLSRDQVRFDQHLYEEHN
jgi:hypothetical protein